MQNFQIEKTCLQLLKIENKTFTNFASNVRPISQKILLALAK